MQKYTAKYSISYTFAAAIKEKFGEVHFNKKWANIRQSLNQKCLDSKRKLSKIEEALED